MSQFTGDTRRVRCIDCANWTDARCSVKDTKVSPKKRRTCSVYEFKGEYTNRTPFEARYVPHVDKKIQRTIRRLLELGVIPVAEDGTVSVEDGYTKVTSVAMPSSTATARNVVENRVDERLVRPVERPALDDLDDSLGKLIWTPDDENG